MDYMKSWRIVVEVHDPMGQRFTEAYAAVPGDTLNAAIDYTLKHYCNGVDRRAGWSIRRMWGVPELLCSPDVFIRPIDRADFERQDFQRA